MSSSSNSCLGDASCNRCSCTLLQLRSSWTISLAWIRQQNILDRAAFDRSSLVTYSPEEYLPPLDTGASEAPKAQKGDPVLRQAADSFRSARSGQPVANHRCASRSQARPRCSLPNIVATGAIVPAVPLDATQASLNAMVAPRDAGRGARAGRAVCARPRGAGGDEVGHDRAASGSDDHHTRGLAGPRQRSWNRHRSCASKGRWSMNIGPSEVVAPAPQLTLAEQHSRWRARPRTSAGWRRATGRSSAERGGRRRQRERTADRVGDSSRRAHRASRGSRRQSPRNILRDSAGKSRALRERRI